jgi:hypothetical protein
MKNLLAALCLAFLSLGAAAESNRTINYTGQNGESFELDTINTITRYKEEERDSTCTRQIPYEVEECGYETRYRQECNWRPGRRECRTEYDTRCRTVTRYRRQCTRTPDRRVCRNTQPTRICRNGVCRTEPGRRICDTKPGRETCRQVPYQDRECTREPRQVCNQIPGRNVCTDVPYQEYRCQMVTRYRSEDYACRRTFKVPYSFDRKVNANVEVSFAQQDMRNPMVDFIFSLTEQGQISVKALDKSSKPALISMKSTNPSDVVSDDFTSIGRNYQFEILNKEVEMAPIKKAISSVGLTKSAAYFTIGKVTNKDRLRVKLVIVRDGPFSGPKTRFNKTLTANDIKLTNSGSNTKVSVNLAKYGVELKDKKHEVSIEVSLNFENDIINLKREPFKRKQDFEIKVK